MYAKILRSELDKAMEFLTIKTGSKETIEMQQIRLHNFHLRNLAPIGESVSILTESNDPLDPYGRILAYVFLPDRTCLNEKMIEDGFAKPYDRYFCSRLADYQILSSQARLAGRGLFSRVNNF